jgi:hypothetical protein
MKFARWVFLIASIYGVLVLIPGFFLERQVGELTPPAITHPEFYYGFYGSALVWQFLFFAISRNPSGLRPFMLLAVIEKIAFFVPGMVLFLTGRLAPGGPFIGALIDGVLMCLFLAAWWLSRPHAAQTASG